jgi:Tol biopolymer transport system component
MPIAIGSRIGPYEVVAPLGRGGMGEVYRARDTRLGRDVALKLLPEAFAGDADRLARFEREAQVLASLNHSHLAQIYGLEETGGARALAMELVDGQTLADRVAAGRGGLVRVPVSEALSIARQIADALEAAHDKGIIHRDLKPANVMVSSDGKVKVLDFGLAAVAQGAGVSGGDASNSPTLTMAATRAGVILGTAAYMSPEQAAGKPVDRRTDVWSFGVVLWEVLAGRRLFDGETISHTLADVLRAEIDFAQLPAETPRVVRELLRRCLDRDARSRLRDIGEARVALDRYLANPAADDASNARSATPVVSSRMTAAAGAVAGLAILGAAGLAVVHFRERPPAVETVRFQMFPPEQTSFAYGATLSPDGRRIAFEGPGPDGRLMIWLRSLDAVDARPLPGTEGVAAGLFWSPDSRSLGFAVNGFPSRLKRVDAGGGPPQTVCEFNGSYRQGSWNEDGVILFAAAPGGVSRVAVSGGTAAALTKTDPSRQETQHAAPVFLADRRHFLYHRASRAPGNRGIYVGAIDLPPEQQSLIRLVAAESDPVLAGDATGRERMLLFLRDGSLLAQPFDGQTRLTGDPTVLAADIGNVGTYGFFSASRTGHLAFRTGRAAGNAGELVWFGRDGRRLAQLGPRSDYAGGSGAQLSPDGKRVIVTRTETGEAGAGGNITRAWTAEVSRGIFSRLNPGEGTEASPAVSADGRVAFTSTIDGAVGDVYWMPSTGVGTPEPLLTKSPTVKHPNDISPDGRFLVYDDHTSQQQDLYVLPIGASAVDRKPIPFVATRADETFAQFSPDGKWIAYTSDESGRREVYVQGFAPDRVPVSAVGKWPISTAGGDKPRWSRDGREIYYISPDRKLMAVPIKIGSTFEPGVAVALFDLPRITGFFPYAVAADGRFLLNTQVESGPTAAPPVTIVLNWSEELQARVPTR